MNEVKKSVTGPSLGLRSTPRPVPRTRPSPLPKPFHPISLNDPSHKRTQSSRPQPLSTPYANKSTAAKRPPLHHRCNTRSFDIENEQTNLSSSTCNSPPIITEEDEDECSESEEIIRKILKEREQSAIDRRESASIAGFQHRISQLIVLREAETQQKNEARAQLKRDVLSLIHSATSSRADTPDTVVTMKSSLASVTTVIELRSDCTDVDCSSVDTDVRRSKDLTNKAVPIPSPLKKFRPNNLRLIKHAISTICLPGDVNKRMREEIFQALDGRQTYCNFVIVFKGALGRHELGAVYEQDQSQCLLHKIIGPVHYPDRVLPALVQSCYHYDSSLHVFCPMKHKKFTYGTDAVALRRRL